VRDRLETLASENAGRLRSAEEHRTGLTRLQAEVDGLAGVLGEATASVSRLAAAYGEVLPEREASAVPGASPRARAATAGGDES